MEEGCAGKIRHGGRKEKEKVTEESKNGNAKTEHIFENPIANCEAVW